MIFLLLIREFYLYLSFLLDDPLGFGFRIAHPSLISAIDTKTVFLVLQTGSWGAEKLQDKFIYPES